jgi:hypothetical protein
METHCPPVVVTRRIVDDMYVIRTCIDFDLPVRASSVWRLVSFARSFLEVLLLRPRQPRP